MNVDTGELRRYISAEDAKKQGFTPIPPELVEEVNRELGNKDSVTVDLFKKSKLAKWAKQQRRKKIAKKSRKANREKRRCKR